jgi:hypothetical protein
MGMAKIMEPQPRQFRAECMTCCVDKRVGNVKNNDPSLIEPVAA